MTPKQFEAVERIFEDALESSKDARVEFVHSATSDEAVRRKVIGMLEKDALESGLERSPLGKEFRLSNLDVIEQSLIDELARSSNIRVIEKIGEGGFGAVYKAEQLRPVKRLVALKVIKLGMDTRQVVARFEAERQALAMMDHPAIAKVFEAGATPSGRPYFAMELVAGVPITRYCDERKLSINDRLALFVRVCRAVQHAHQKGIIHRDLKPSNVLMSEHDGQALPKVIDFGIARAVGSAMDSGSAMTVHGQPLGTPTYMSPEQAAGERDIDTRSDVYSLGVMLYELLTGEPTLQRATIDRATPAEVVRRVKEMHVDPPSQRVLDMGRTGQAECAGRRNLDSNGLSRRLRGDLDWIVLTALERERSRRYETVDAFAVDIERHLANEPIQAHPPTATYRLKKFALRNRATIVVVLLILLALIGTSVGLVRSRAAETQARTDAQIAQEINDFLNNDLLASVAPEELGNEVRMREVLDAASKKVEGRFANRPEVEASIRLTIGRTLKRLSAFDECAGHLQRSLDLRSKLFGDDDLRTLEVVQEVGELRMLLEDYAESQKLLTRAAEGRRRQLGAFDLSTIQSEYSLAVVVGEQGHYDITDRMMEDLLVRCKTHLGESHKQTLIVLRGLGVLYRSTGRIEQAVAAFETCYAQARKTLGVNNTWTLLTMQDLARLLPQQGQTQRALEIAQEALDASKIVRGERHPATITAIGILAQASFANGDSQRAEQLLQSAIDTAKAVLPAGHTVHTRMVLSLAEIYDKQKLYEKSEPLLIGALSHLRERLGFDNPLTLEATQSVIAHYRARGMNAMADEISRQKK